MGGAAHNARIGLELGVPSGCHAIQWGLHLFFVLQNKKTDNSMSFFGNESVGTYNPQAAYARNRDEETTEEIVALAHREEQTLMSIESELSNIRRALFVLVAVVVLGLVVMLISGNSSAPAAGYATGYVGGGTPGGN